jgi:uncharacterized membrane protein YhaH (DUF805 family)
MNPNMSPVDWAKRPLQKYADFTGRAPRPEYWWYVLGLIIAGVIVGIVEGIMGLKGMVMGIYGPLTLLLMLATIVPSVAAGARRLHDTNRSGWWLLLAFVPYALMLLLRPAAGSPFGGMALFGIASLIALICGIVVLVFLVLPGTPGENRYGPNPYGGDSGAAIAAE